MRPYRARHLVEDQHRPRDRDRGLAAPRAPLEPKRHRNRLSWSRPCRRHGRSNMRPAQVAGGIPLPGTAAPLQFPCNGRGSRSGHRSPGRVGHSVIPASPNRNSLVGRLLRRLRSWRVAHGRQARPQLTSSRRDDMPDIPWAGLLALVAMFVIPFLPDWLFEGPRTVRHRPRRHVCGDCGAPWTDQHQCGGEPAAEAPPLPGELRRLERTTALEPRR